MREQYENELIEEKGAEEEWRNMQRQELEEEEEWKKIQRQAQEEEEWRNIQRQAQEEEEWRKEDSVNSELGDYDFIKYRCDEDLDPELKRDFGTIRRNLQNQQREAEALMDWEQREQWRAEKDEENWATQPPPMDEEDIQRDEDWHIAYYSIVQEQKFIEEEHELIEQEEEWRRIQEQGLDGERDEGWREIQEWHKVLLQHPLHYCTQSFVISEEEDEWPIEDEDFDPDKFYLPLYAIKELEKNGTLSKN